jgi:hypothetical protein
MSPRRAVEDFVAECGGLCGEDRDTVAKPRREYEFNALKLANKGWFLFSCFTARARFILFVRSLVISFFLSLVLFRMQVQFALE